MTMARAMAARWRSPPESWSGRWSMRSPEAHRRPGPPPRARARSSGGTPAKTMGSSTFPFAVRRGTMWKAWKTKPILWRRMRDSRGRPARVTSCPSSRYVPDVGRSRHPSRFEQRRLARPRRAHHRQVLPVRHHEVDAPQGVDGPAPDLEDARDPAELDHFAVSSATRARAPSFTSARSRETTTASPAARPLLTSAKLQFRSPISTGTADERPVAQDQGLLAVDQGVAGDAQDAVAGVEDDLDVGRAAGQQRPREGRVVQVHLDLEGAALLLHVHHVRRDAGQAAGEGPAGIGVDRDPHRLARAHPPHVHLVERRADVDRVRVEQLHAAPGSARPGGEGVIHSPTSPRRSATTPSKGARSSVLPRVARAKSSEAWDCCDPGAGRLAGGGRRVTLGLGLLLQVLRDEAVAGQRGHPRKVALGLLGPLARLALARVRGLDRALLEVDLGLVVRAGQAHEELALADPVSLLHRQRLDASADLRAERGPPPRLDRPGLAVGDGLLDPARAPRGRR